MSSVPGPADRGRILLRNGYTGSVCPLVTCFGATLSYKGIYRPVTNADYPSLEKLADGAIKEKQKFERLVVSKEKLLEMFHVRLLTSFQKDETLTAEDSITNTKNT